MTNSTSNAQWKSTQDWSSPSPIQCDKSEACHTEYRLPDSRDTVTITQYLCLRGNQ